MMCGVKYEEKKESLRISKEMHRKCLYNNDFFFLHIKIIRVMIQIDSPFFL